MLPSYKEPIQAEQHSELCRAHSRPRQMLAVIILTDHQAKEQEGKISHEVPAYKSGLSATCGSCPRVRHLSRSPSGKV